MNTAPTRCNRGSEPAPRLHRRAGVQPRAVVRGLSLIELMVSMAISLFIVLIAATLYVEGAHNLGFLVGQNENLGNSRYALGTLDSEFSKAGYRRDPTRAMGQAFPADGAAHTNGCQFAAGQAIYAIDAQTLCIRFQARDNDETDCAGSPAGIAGLKPYEAPATPGIGAGLFVEKYALSDGKLVCTAGNSAQATQVADGVRDLHFEFGVGEVADSFAERRVEAFKTEVPSSNDAIRSLRYAILLVSSAGGLTRGMESSVCSRWQAMAGNANTSCDNSNGQLYQLASGSLTLRNLMP